MEVFKETLHKMVFGDKNAEMETIEIVIKNTIRYPPWKKV